MKTKSTKLNKKNVWIAITAVAALAIVWFVTFGPWSPMGHWAWRVARYSGPVITLGVLSLVPVYLYYNRGYEKKWILGAGATAGLLVPVVLLASFYYPNVQMYKNTEWEYLDDGDSLSYQARTPYEVAMAVSNRSMGDTTGNSSGHVKAIISKDVYTNNISKREWFSGYEATQVMDLPLYGSPSTSDVSFCNYSEEAGLRLGGLWGVNSLNSAIYSNVGLNTFFNSGDAFAYCEEGEPTFYIPLKKLKGIVFPYQVPAGVAVYNGSTGSLEILEESDVEMPVYPLSLAAKQRASLYASNGAKGFFMRYAGFDTSDYAVNCYMKDDKEVCEKGNNSEVTLKNLDTGKTEYTTLLTPRGSSDSIVGVMTVEQGKVEKNVLNKVQIHRYENSRPALSTVSADIISDSFEGYKASGLKIFEIVPFENGEWSASIGKEQSILYRAVISEDGTITLYDSKMGKVEEVNKVEEFDKDDVVAEFSISGSLSEMTVEELEEYADQLLTEVSQVHEELVKRTK